MQSSCIRVALASNNCAKLAATEQAFGSMFQAVEIRGHSVTSAVSETPATDEEAITGCKNRLAKIKRLVNCDYAVALEGLMERRPFGAFIYGWAVVHETKTERFAFGCSGKVMVPPHLIESFRPVDSLADHVSRVYPGASQADVLDRGTNGIITNGAYNRIDEFYTAIRCAIGYILNKSNFPPIDS